MTRWMLLMGLAACAVEPTGTAEQASKKTDGCSNSDCGTNSTVIDGVYFSDLDLLGTPNAQGVFIVNYPWLPNGGTALRIAGDHERLVAVDAFGATVAEHLDLIGTQIRVGIGPKRYIIQIADVHRTLEYWAANDHSPVESYTFEYVAIVPPPPDSTFHPLCDADPVAGLTYALDALVFDGDLYTPATKAINTSPPPGWFNVACLGGAPAKMELMRHTGASSNPPAIKTSDDERHALFDAWTGNYCGDGEAFTVPHTPLRMKDSRGWLSATAPIKWTTSVELSSYEAVWDGHGAVCLDTPRLADYEKVIEHCAAVRHDIPRCSDLSWFPLHWAEHGHIFTGNPS